MTKKPFWKKLANASGRLLSAMKNLRFGRDTGLEGNGNVVTRTRTSTAPVEHIEVSGPFTVELTEGTEPEIQIKTDQNLHDRVRVEMDNNTLTADTRRSISNPTTLTLQVTSNQLQSLNCSGAVEVQSTNTLESGKLSVKTSGASDLRLDLDVSNLNISLSGGSDVDLSGRADSVESNLSGAGDFNSLELDTNHFSLDASGAVDVKVRARETLNLDVSGAGSVRYKGNPRVKQDISGMTSIKTLEE